MGLKGLGGFCKSLRGKGLGKWNLLECVFVSSILEAGGRDDEKGFDGGGEGIEELRVGKCWWGWLIGNLCECVCVLVWLNASC